VLDDSLADFVCTTYIDKNILLAVANAVGEPAMDPLSSRNRPRVPAVIAAFDAEKNFHPDNCRPAQRLLPLGDAQLDRFFRHAFERKLVFTGGAFLPPGVERVARATDTDRINFLRVNRRPILQPRACLFLDRLQSLLRNAAIACGKVKPGEK